MQDKETVDDAEEALTIKTDVVSDRQPTPDPKKDSPVTKDGKFAFRKMKQPKKEKTPKKSVSRFEGEGIIFKAKLIGVESVTDPRGDKMCQDAMQRLKLNVRNTGPHKRKINICVSLQGIKVKDEKFGNVIFHHPVSLISFISQDITDARAFGYVFGSTGEPHQFIAIKTEKPAFHVVLALRDLFQTVLNHKQVEIQNVKEQTNDVSIENGTLSENKINPVENSEASKPIEETKVNENIYFEVLLTEPIVNQRDIQVEPLPEPVKTVDDLIGLQSEMNQLQEGINQMDTSIAAVVAFNTEVPAPENDPFDTSFVLGPKRDSFPLPMPTPVPVTTAPPPSNDTQRHLSDLSTDKYAIFSAIDSIAPSVFQEPTADDTSKDEAEEEDENKTPPLTVTPAPAKPPRLSKSPDMSVFADLDPLGKDRPYKDKTEFFQDVKNPPKKVLNDLVDPNKEPKPFDPSSVPFPVDFVSMSSPPSNSTPLSNGFKPQSSFPNPFKTTTDNGFAPPMNGAQNLNNTSSPIPIPSSNETIFRERSVSNGSSAYYSNTDGSLSNNSIYCTTDGSFSNGSVYSKSPLQESDSDYYISNYMYLEGKNGNISPNNNNTNLTKQNINNLLGGVSRPRPRPSLSKGNSIPNGGRTVSSHSLSSDSSSDYEAISRESMQSIANVLTNGRLRAQSLCLEGGRLKSQIGEDSNIFAKKADPFADDDFFFSLPKKNTNILLQTKTEIPEYV